jgi:hypothetical protein
MQTSRFNMIDGRSSNSLLVAPFASRRLSFTRLITAAPSNFLRVSRELACG